MRRSIAATPHGHACKSARSAIHVHMIPSKYPIGLPTPACCARRGECGQAGGVRAARNHPAFGEVGRLLDPAAEGHTAAIEPLGTIQGHCRRDLGTPRLLTAHTCSADVDREHPVEKVVGSLFDALRGSSCPRCSRACRWVRRAPRLLPNSRSKCLVSLTSARTAWACPPVLRMADTTLSPAA